MTRGRALQSDLRRSFFFNRRDHHVITLGPRRIQHKKRKPAISGNQPKFLSAVHYLITPSSEASINRISLATSSPPFVSAFNPSSACEVFSFDASNSRYA